MTPRRVGVALFAVALVAGTSAGARTGASATAETIRDAKHRFELRVRTGVWVPVPDDPSHTEPLRAMRSKDGARVLAVSRVDFRNPRAWRRDKYFFQTVERGVRDNTHGYKRLHRKRRRLAKRVPAFDLVFAHDRAGEREVVAMRFLFFRRYTLTLAVSQPLRTYRRNKRHTRKLLDSFRPYFAPPIKR